jgi:transcriptional regulator with XRE-family HTH domain
MHIRTFFRQSRGDRTLAEASEATGISRGTLSRIERGEQFPKAEQCDRIFAFYCPAGVAFEIPVDWLLGELYPASVLRLLQLERKCACGCGRSLPPDSLRSKRYLDGHRKHVRRA